MEAIKTEEKSVVVILTEKEHEDIVSAVYFAMKRLDESGGNHDIRLSDRLEVMHDKLTGKA